MIKTKCIVGGLLADNRYFKDLLARKYPFKNFMGNYTISSGQKIEITLEYFNYGLAYIICDRSYSITHINSVGSQYVDVINSGFTHTEGNQGTINVWRNSSGTIFIENKKSETLTIQVRLFSMEKTDR